MNLHVRVSTPSIPYHSSAHLLEECVWIARTHSPRTSSAARSFSFMSALLVASIYYADDLTPQPLARSPARARVRSPRRSALPRTRSRIVFLLLQPRTRHTPIQRHGDWRSWQCSQFFSTHSIRIVPFAVWRIYWTHRCNCIRVLVVLTLNKQWRLYLHYLVYSMCATVCVYSILVRVY